MLLAFALLGCAEEAEEIRFAATISPLGAVVEPVAGLRVNILVPAGGSPHTYEPRPSDARRAARAAILFYGSDELDGWAAALDTGERVALVDLLPDSVRRPAYRGRGTDPHFWMDPRAVQAVLPGVAGVLCRHDAPACAAYRQNALDFAGELAAVHDSLRVLLAPAAGASMMLSHAFLTYFADRYELRIAGVIEELAGSEPSPREMERLIETARTSGARAIFTQPLHSSRTAEAIAEAAGIPVVEIDPISAANELPALLYLNARRIRDALIDPTSR